MNLTKKETNLLFNVNDIGSSYSEDVVFSKLDKVVSSFGNVTEIQEAIYLYYLSSFYQKFNSIDRLYRMYQKYLKTIAKDDIKKIANLCCILVQCMFPIRGRMLTYRSLYEKNKSVSKKAKGQYPFIPKIVNGFVKNIISNNLYLKGKNFIDIGSGNAEKLLIVKFLSPKMKVTGIEYETGLHNYARHCLSKISKNYYNLLNKNAFVCRLYHKFDRIYLYRPLAEDEAMFRLASLISSNLKSGTILYTDYCGSSFEMVFKSKNIKYRSIGSELFQIT